MWLRVRIFASILLSSTNSDIKALYWATQFCLTEITVLSLFLLQSVSGIYSLIVTFDMVTVSKPIYSAPSPLYLRSLPTMYLSLRMVLGGRYAGRYGTSGE